MQICIFINANIKSKVKTEYWSYVLPSIRGVPSRSDLNRVHQNLLILMLVRNETKQKQRKTMIEFFSVSFQRNIFYLIQKF